MLRTLAPYIILIPPVIGMSVFFLPARRLYRMLQEQYPDYFSSVGSPEARNYGKIVVAAYYWKFAYKIPEGFPADEAMLAAAKNLQIAARIFLVLIIYPWVMIAIFIAMGVLKAFN